MRKKLPQILIFVFIFILIAGWVSAAQAITYQPKIEIPGGPSGNIDENSIGQYISAVYKYAIGAVGILATVALMLGGIFWITAGGNAERVGSARAWIGGALTGLVLVLGSYMILKTVNPDLVTLKPIKLPPVKPITIHRSAVGCCEWSDGCANGYTESECTSYKTPQDDGGVYRGQDYYCEEGYPRCVIKLCCQTYEMDPNSPIDCKNVVAETDCPTQYYGFGTSLYRQLLFKNKLCFDGVCQ